jgi:hypothetical protein
MVLISNHQAPTSHPQTNPSGRNLQSSHGSRASHP